MTTILITGGDVAEAINAATDQIDRGRRVVVFHAFPAPSAARFPGGVEKVFRVEDEETTPEEIAAIYHAARVIDLDMPHRRA